MKLVHSVGTRPQFIKMRPFLNVPCVTLREETEWMETVEQGWNAVAGTSEKGILKGFREMLATGSRAGPDSFYGSGKAAASIVAALFHNYSGRARGRSR